jgi:ketosteroid isomerase-like protein
MQLPVTEEPVLEASMGRSAAGDGDVVPTAARPLRAAMIATWPLELDQAFEGRHSRDPWLAIVRESVMDYREGRADRARQRWSDDIRWRLSADAGLKGEWVGPEQVFNLHRLLRRETDNTFRQRLIALEGGRGPFVDAHLRTTAERAGRRLDISTLLVFELSNGRISCVTELPGDREAWRVFWSD